MKICPLCRQQKEQDQFSRMAKAKDGLQYACKACSRERAAAWRSVNPRPETRSREERTAAQRRRRIGAHFSPEVVAELAERQGHACAICRTPESEMTGGLHLDHSHVTGQIRGLLCRKCNTGIGLLGDEPNGLQRALNYLEGGT